MNSAARHTPPPFCSLRGGSHKTRSRNTHTRKSVTRHETQNLFITAQHGMGVAGRSVSGPTIRLTRHHTLRRRTRYNELSDSDSHSLRPRRDTHLREPRVGAGHLL